MPTLKNRYDHAENGPNGSFTLGHRSDETTYVGQPTYSGRLGGKRRTSRIAASVSSERGAALVEFVFVVPFLLFMFFGIVLFGMMLSLKQSVTQAAEEGARNALGVFVVGGNQTATDQERMQQAFDAVRDNLSFLDARCCDTNQLLLTGRTAGASTYVTIDIDTCTNSTNDCITVNIAYDYDADPLVAVPSDFPPFSFVIPDEIVGEAVIQLDS